VLSSLDIIHLPVHISVSFQHDNAQLLLRTVYRGADKSLAWPGRKQVTATEDFDFHISYL